MHCKRKDIHKLSELFGLDKDKIWNLMRGGTQFIYGKKFIFIKADDFYTKIQSYEDDTNLSIIAILDIETGRKEKHKYRFFEITGDALDTFSKGVSNANLIYQFKTDEKFNLTKITL